MSLDEVAGQAITGEFSAENSLKLFSYEPPRYKIPVKHKYTGRPPVNPKKQGNVEDEL